MSTPQPPAPADEAPAFFQPDQTYQRRRWLFQCLAVAPNPFNQEIRAVGFLYRPGEPATATALDPDDWEHGEWMPSVPRPCAECPETAPTGRAYCSTRCRNAADRHDAHDEMDGDL